MLYTVVWEQCSVWPMQSFVEIVDVCVVMLGSGEANCRLLILILCAQVALSIPIIIVFSIDSFQRQLSIYQTSSTLCWRESVTGMGLDYL